jgi:uncharacterized protein (DUF2249 family)
MNENMTLNQPLLDANKVFDVRPIPCSSKHALILRVWNEIQPGDFFVLLNGSDPVPLRNQFAADFGGAFSWEYLERGPEGVRIKISKLKAAPAREAFTTTSSCGHNH